MGYQPQKICSFGVHVLTSCVARQFVSFPDHCVVTMIRGVALHAYLGSDDWLAFEMDATRSPVSHDLSSESSSVVYLACLLKVRQDGEFLIGDSQAIALHPTRRPC